MPDAVALSFTVIRSPAWKSDLIHLLFMGVKPKPGLVEFAKGSFLGIQFVESGLG
jgi:hypothetical protein